MSTNWIDDVVKSSPDSGLIAWSGEVEFSGASESDTGGRRVKLRLVQSPEAQSKAHPFSKFTRRQRNQGGARFEGSFVGVDKPFELMAELYMTNWASTPKGAFIELCLTFEAEKHPFLGCARPTAQTPGSRFMLVCVEKTDDEQIVNQTKVELEDRTRAAGRRQTLSNVARYLTKNPMFWAWVREVDDETVDSINKADAWLKAKCQIESKADLDSEGPEAIAPITRFHKLRQLFVSSQEDDGHD